MRIFGATAGGDIANFKWGKGRAAPKAPAARLQGAFKPSLAIPGRGAAPLLLSTGAAVLAALAPSGAAAQPAIDERTGETFYPYLVADKIVVEGHKVDRGLSESSATKTPTPLVDIPQSITVIDEDLIRRQAMRSMADVLRYVPGAAMGQGEGHRDAPTLRGNSSTADFYVDGVRDDVQYFRDLYNVERIEVLKGPNAMIFGRGGGGGVINRVLERAAFERTGELRLEGGQFGFGRIAVDYGDTLSESLGARVNGVFENSDSYRDFVGVERFGLNPTAALKLGGATVLHAGLEHFSDARTVDRGVPSQAGRPYDGDRRAFFGNPDQSLSDIETSGATAVLDHEVSPDLTLRNHLSFRTYDKFYSNVHANSAVDSLGNVRLQSYFSTTQRRNLFNQTDLVWRTATGPLRHQILAGAEFGLQKTENFRTENNNAAGVVSIANPTTYAVAAYASARNDNLVDLTTASVYVQDEIAIGDRVQLIGGVRFDRFDLEFDDARAGFADFERTDEVFSPRGGVVVKPREDASLYFSYAKSFLPQSGDQFDGLTATTASLKPEAFENLEIGVKWDITPELAFTAAAYRLDRENTRALDPLTNLTVLTGAQRSRGVEVGLAGSICERWDIVAGYALQEAEITRSTTAAPAGRLTPLTPKHAFSLWNSYRFTDRFGAALGVVHQGDVFASLSNAVTLPDFTRVDAALFFAVSDRLDVQLNVENLLDANYFPTAHNDNNITPGSPRAFRAALTARL